MPRHGENIYKRKDGRYEGRYVIGRTEKGKTRFGYVYGRRYMDVKKRLLNKKNEISFQQTGIRKNCDYKWLAEYWLKHEAVTRISLSSFSCYRRMIQNQLIPFFGGIRLINLKTHHIQRFLCQLTARGLAHSTRLACTMPVGSYSSLSQRLSASTTRLAWDLRTILLMEAD